ncbi:MAG: diacylglycerol kinase [Alphaproteobacteria bacterium]|nr:diacylglycerol kinase [Alphaproteobacteria bacterium]
MADTYNILINQQSGTALAAGQEKIERWFSDSGLNVKNLCFAASEDIQEQHSRFLDTNTPLLIGGGDGTIASIAPACIKHKKPFGILPMGTMNLLAKDLGIPDTSQAAIKAYAENAVVKTMDAGFVNDELFLCNASLGAIPETTKIREGHRSMSETVIAPRLALFVMEHLDEMHHRPYGLHLGKGKKIKIKTPMLVIANNCYEDSGYNRDHSFKRESLNANIMGVYSSQPYTFWDKIRFFLRLSQGGWKKDPIVKEWRSSSVKITSKNETELVALDGENRKLKTPLMFRIEHNGLQVLVPGDDA